MTSRCRTRPRTESSTSVVSPASPTGSVGTHPSSAPPTRRAGTCFRPVPVTTGQAREAGPAHGRRGRARRGRRGGGRDRAAGNAAAGASQAPVRVDGDRGPYRPGYDGPDGGNARVRPDE